MPDQEYKIHIVSSADNTGYKSATAAQEELTQETKKGNTATVDDAEVSKKTATEVEGVDIKKRELLESTRALTREMPILGEIMRSVYNPIGFSIFAIIGAIEIWISKLKNLSEAMGGIELPNFGAHIKDAENIATAYDGIAKSVNGADEEFNSAASAFERQQKAIEGQLAAVKQLITAQKEKAIADLDMERASGKMGPATYDARKSIIEQGYNDQTVQAEINARNADLQAKKDEQARLEQEAAKKNAAADAIKLPSDDLAVDAQITEVKALADAFKKQAEDLRAKLAAVNAMDQTLAPGQGLQGLKDVIAGLPDIMKYSAQYGGLTKPADVAAMINKSASSADAAAEAAEKEAARIEKEKADREKLRKEKEKAAADAEKLRLENAGQDNPNQVGSVAWKNAQAAKSQGIKDSAGEENRFTKDLTNFNKDLETYQATAGSADPQALAIARKTMADLHEGFRDAMAVVNELAAHGDDTAQMRRDIAEMRQKLTALQQQNNSMPGQGR